MAKTPADKKGMHCKKELQNNEKIYQRGLGRRTD